MNYADLGVSAVIINAGTRIEALRVRHSSALESLGGRSLLTRVLNVAIELQPQRIIVVAPQGADDVRADLADHDHHVDVAESLEQAADAAGSDEAIIVDIATPLVRPQTLAGALLEHRQNDCEVTFIAATKDFIHPHLAVASRSAIREVLAGVQVEELEVSLHNTGHRFTMSAPADERESDRITDRATFIEISRYLNQRTVQHWIDEGVMIMSPETTWIQDNVTIGQGVTIMPNTYLEGATTIGSGVKLGPDTTIRDAEVDDDATITRAHVELSVIGPGATVGPFAYVRPGTQLGVKGKIGTFVETKNSIIGDGAKVPHLCYCGDGIVDAGANIGAGTIFANYDGQNKSKTHVGKNSFVGSNSVLVAPVDIADGAYVAAGSAVVNDVPAGALAVARGRQHVAHDWVTTRKPDSKTAAAAHAAEAGVHPAVQADRDKLNNITPKEG